MVLDKSDTFLSSARELRNQWHDSLNRGYPFEASFDEWISHVLTHWADEVREELETDSRITPGKVLPIRY